MGRNSSSKSSCLSRFFGRKISFFAVCVWCRIGPIRPLNLQWSLEYALIKVDRSRLRDTLRHHLVKKANLRDLIAATGLVILLKLDLNRRFYSPCDLEIWWMTPKNNRAPLLCYFKLFASFRSHWWIQTGVRVRKRPIWVKCYAF